MKRHPWGKVPAVVFEDGFTLYESRPICQYIARMYKLPLIPTDSDARAVALFEQAAGVEANYFNPPAGRISFEKLAKAKFLGLPADEQVVAAAVKELDGFFGIVEGLLQDKEYMAGDNFSLVDIYYIPLVRRLFLFGFSDMITGRQNVAAWWERCVSRPAIKKLIDEDTAAAAAAAAASEPKKEA